MTDTAVYPGKCSRIYFSLGKSGSLYASNALERPLGTLEASSSIRMVLFCFYLDQLELKSNPKDIFPSLRASKQTTRMRQCWRHNQTTPD